MNVQHILAADYHANPAPKPRLKGNDITAIGKMMRTLFLTIWGALIALKLADLLPWSWWRVLAPVWLTIVTFLAIFALVALYLVVSDWLCGRNLRRRMP